MSALLPVVEAAIDSAFSFIPGSRRGYVGTAWVSTREDLLPTLLAANPEERSLAVDNPNRLHVTRGDKTLFLYRMHPDDVEVSEVVGQPALFVVLLDSLNRPFQDLLVRALVRATSIDPRLGFLVSIP